MAFIKKPCQFLTSPTSLQGIGETEQSQASYEIPENRSKPLEPCCPIHGDLMVEQTSPKGFNYFRCPHFNSFSIKNCGMMVSTLDLPWYLETVTRTLHPQIRIRWDNMNCSSEKNPGRLYMTCRFKECNFFQLADIPLILKKCTSLDLEASKSLPKKEITSPFNPTMGACLPCSSRNYPKSVSQVSRNELDCDCFD